MTLKNFYTANATEPGDIFLVTIKATIQYDGSYRLYRCKFEGDDVPEGDRLVNVEEIVAEAIFPILRTANGPDFK